MVGVVHINLARSWRGGERQVIFLMESLKSKEVNQVLICIKNSALHFYCRENNLPFKSYTNVSVFLFIPFLIAVWSLKKKYQIIHCHESRGHTIAFIAKLLFRVKIRLILHRRVLFPIKQKYFTQLKYSPAFVDKIICISKAVENVVLNCTTNKNTVVIPSGIRLSDYDSSSAKVVDIRKSYSISAKHKIVAYIAALTFEKDHFTFLDAAKEILSKNQKVHFLLIGDGQLLSELKEYARSLNIDKQVTFSGFVDNPERLIPQMDVLLFPSVSEGLGSTILDFFANKRAVVAARNGGAEELINNNFNGFLCDIKDWKSMADKVLLLLKDHDLYKIFVDNSFQLVCDRFLMEKVTSLIIQEYV